MFGLNYHTIDPLILQTLNLNQRRMNHILNILHGRPSNMQPQTIQLKIAKNHFQNSLREDRKSSKKSLLLPQISKRNLTIQTDRKNKINDRNYFTLDKNKPYKATSKQKNQIASSSFKHQQDLNLEPNAQSKQKTILKHKIQRRRTVNESVTPISFLNFSKIQQAKVFSQGQDKKQPRNSLSAVRTKLISSKVSHLQSPSMKELSPTKKQGESILEESLMPNPTLIEKQEKKQQLSYRKKKKQMINDYMGEYTLKKSKSMQVLNSKDIYRLEIENIVAELTPIDKLEDAQKKMKRIKRRHQHLKHFDQKYYSKLNEMDLVTL